MMFSFTFIHSNSFYQKDFRLTKTKLREKINSYDNSDLGYVSVKIDPKDVSVEIDVKNISMCPISQSCFLPLLFI